jgi:hypothetical protein
MDRRWREVNRDRHLTNARARQRRWRAANMTPEHKVREREARRTWCEANRDRDRANQRRWYEGNASDACERVRAHKLKRHYGLSVTEYDAMHAAQAGACAICRQPETSKHQSGRVKRLAVDHSAVTRRVRQLLCNACNQAIGMMKHNPDRLRAAAAYLERHEEKTAA